MANTKTIDNNYVMTTKWWYTRSWGCRRWHKP